MPAQAGKPQGIAIGVGHGHLGRFLPEGDARKAFLAQGGRYSGQGDQGCEQECAWGHGANFGMEGRVQGNRWILAPKAFSRSAMRW